MENKISILLIEDEDIWLHELELMLTTLGFQIAGIARSLESALTAIRTISFDMALVDIQLNNHNSGLEIGRMLSDHYIKPYIFLTAIADYDCLSEAVMCRPSAYLPKPINQASLFVTIQAAISNFASKQQPELNTPTFDAAHFFIKQGTNYKKVEWHDVVSLVSEKNYTRIVTRDNKTCYTFRSSLQKAMNIIIPHHLRSSFVQINRAEALNIAHIERLNADEVITSAGNYAIGSTYADNLKQLLNILS